MTYRLKDAALQKKLDELSKGAFSELIATSGGVFAREDKSLLKLGNGRFIVVLHKEDFEAVYNPDDWNNYPEVTPPEGVLMRVETEGGRKFCGYFHTFPDGVGRWCCVCFTPRHMPLRETEKVRRFRPWE